MKNVNIGLFTSYEIMKICVSVYNNTIINNIISFTSYWHYSIRYSWWSMGSSISKWR